MQWLDKFDQVLDRAFAPSSPVRRDTVNDGEASSEPDLAEMLLDFDEDDCLLEDAESSLGEIDMDCFDQQVSGRVKPFKNITPSQFPGMIRPVVRLHEEDSSDDEECTGNDSQKNTDFSTAKERTNIPKYVETMNKEEFQALDGGEFGLSPEMKKTQDSQRSGSLSRPLLGPPPPSPLSSPLELQHGSPLLIEARVTSPLQLYPPLGMDAPHAHVVKSPLPTTLPRPPPPPPPLPPLPLPPPLPFDANKENTVKVKSSSPDLLLLSTSSHHPPTSPPPPPPPPPLPPPPPQPPLLLPPPEHRQTRILSEIEQTTLPRATISEKHTADDVPSTVGSGIQLNEFVHSSLYNEKALKFPESEQMDANYMPSLEEFGGDGSSSLERGTELQKDINEISILNKTNEVSLPQSTATNKLANAAMKPKNYQVHAIQAAMGDFLVTNTFESDDMNYSQDGTNSNITTVTDEEWDDFIISEPIRDWNSNSSPEGGEQLVLPRPTAPPLNLNINCPGVVHVRLLRAQRLPCAPEAALQAIISLPPWKGRIRSKRVIAYDGPDDAIICARWDQANDEINDTNKAGDGATKKGTCDVYSMFHAYNNEDTPIPSIKIEIKDLALQMFEMGVCSLTLSCEPLMRNPGIFKRQWCVAEVGKQRSQTKTTRQQDLGDIANYDDEVTPPLILVEACFEGMNFSDKPTQNQEIENMELYRGDGSVYTDTTPSISLDHDGSAFSETVSIASSTPAMTFSASPAQTAKRLTSKPHMLRITSKWRPTYCTVCSAITVWGLRAYQCEVCKIVCCADCQLRVDVELPCGSEPAKRAIEMAFKSTLKSKVNVNKLFSVLAPIREQIFDDKEVESSDSTSSKEKDERSPIELKGENDGVGNFNLRIVKACLFRRNFPPETEPYDIWQKSDRRLRHGDHYARISWTGSQETKRTRTIFQTAKPRFESSEMSITAMHHGTEFLVEVFDAAKDIPVGCTLLSTQGLLQWQRDELEKEGGIDLGSIIAQQPRKTKMRKKILELRTGVKKGFGLDFYQAGKSSGTLQSGEISGWIELEMCFQENKFSKVLGRPPDEFNVDLIQLHIARIGSLIEEITEIYETYFYVVSWRNPALTGLSLIIFVPLCLKFNAEYVGSLPIAIIFFYIVYCAYVKKRGGGFRSRLVLKERDARLEEAKVATIEYDKHRPISWLNAKVLQGKNLSTEHGIPGSLVSEMIFDPSRLANDKASLIKCDTTSKGAFHVGTTESSGVTFYPVWESMRESNDLVGLKKLLPSSNFLSKNDSQSKLSSNANNEAYFKEAVQKKVTLQFPLLQPISEGGLSLSGNSNDEKKISVKLLPWESSVGAVVFQVRFADVLNRLPLFDDTIGEVVIPLEKIAKMRKIKGWFKLLKKGTRETIEIQPTEEFSEKKNIDNGGLGYHAQVDSDSKFEHNKGIENNDDLNNHPMILLEIGITFPDEQVTDIDRETSIVVAEEMIRLASLSQDTRVGIIGTSISTFNTVRGVTGNIQDLQNQLGGILDMMEMLRNLFNFSHPEKSVLILFCLGILWFLLALVPTKYFFLCAGLGQYAVTLMTVLSQNKSSAEDNINDTMSVVTNKEEVEPSQIGARICNFFYSLPTNEDLRRYYFWEARRVGEREREIVAEKKRSARLRKLWNASWHGLLELKEMQKAEQNNKQWDWVRIFAVIQGHGFIWWNSENDFDDGNDPVGQIFFSGHSGLAGLSPLDLRELKKNEIPMVVSIFGRGLGEQQKLLLLTSDNTIKEDLEKAVLGACTDSKND